MQTWQGAAVPLREDPDTATVVPALYHGSAPSMLRELRSHAGPSDSVVLMIAHNPGSQDLAGLLADDHRSEEYQQLRFKYPTAGIAVLESVDDWHSWMPSSAELVSFAVPRG